MTSATPARIAFTPRLNGLLAATALPVYGGGRHRIWPPCSEQSIARNIRSLSANLRYTAPVDLID